MQLWKASLKQSTFGLFNMSLKQPDLQMLISVTGQKPLQRHLGFFGVFFFFLTQFVGFYCVQVLKDHN